MAWGFTAHRMVTAKAIPLLPPALRPLFAANAAYVVEHAIDPDLWRGAGKPGENPNHFLDMDAFGAFPFPDIPRGRRSTWPVTERTRSKGAFPGGSARLPRPRDAFRAKDSARIPPPPPSSATTRATPTSPARGGELRRPAHRPDRLPQPLESEMVERFERQLLSDVQPAPSAGWRIRWR